MKTMRNQTSARAALAVLAVTLCASGFAAVRELADGETVTYAASDDVGAAAASLAGGTATIAGTINFTNDYSLTIAAGAELVATVQPYRLFPTNGFVLAGGGTFTASSGSHALRVVRIDPAFSGTIVAVDCVLMLPSMSDWPDGMTVTTTEDGLVALRNFTDYDASRVGGTGAVVDDPNRARPALTGVYASGGSWQAATSFQDADGSKCAVKNDATVTGQKGRNAKVVDETWTYDVRGMGGFWGNSGKDEPGMGLRFGAGGLQLTGDTTVKGWFGAEDALLIGASQSWYSYNSGKVTTFTIGREYLKHGVPRLRAEDDVELTITTNFKFLFDGYGELRNADVKLASSAVLEVGMATNASGRCSGYLNARTLKLSGNTATFGYEAGSVPAGCYGVAETVDFVNGGTVSLGESGDAGFRNVKVEAGTGTLTGRASQDEDGAIDVSSGATLAFDVQLDGTVGDDHLLVHGFGLSGAGTVNVSARRLRFKDVRGFTGTLSISDGIVQMPAMADWPADMRVETAGSGYVYLESQDGYDAARVSGSGCAVIVVDDGFAEPSVVLQKGGLLLVRGNGLTAEKTLTLNGGMVLFETSSTIAAPVTVTGIARMETADPRITGEVAGKVTYACTPGGLNNGEKLASVDVYGKGTVVFSGGASFKWGMDHFEVYEGQVVVSNKAFSCDLDKTSKRNPKILVAGAAERLAFVDGGGLTFKPASINLSYLFVNAANGTLEIGTGGAVSFAKNSTMSVSTDAGVTNVVKVNGGDLSFINADRPQTWGTGEGSLAVLQVGEGGSVYHKQAMSTSAVGGYELVFDGGDYRLDAGVTGAAACLFAGDGGRVRVTEKGGALKLYGVGTATNSVSRLAANAWTGTGTLKVEAFDPATEFVFNTALDGDGKSIGVPCGIEPVDVTIRFVGSSADETVRVGTLAVSDNDAEYVLSTEEAQSLAFDRVVVKSGYVWTNAAWANPGFAVSNLVFETGSVLDIPVGDGGAVESLALTGSLTFPGKQSYRLARTPRAADNAVVFTVPEGCRIVEPSAWIRQSGSAKRQPRIRPDAQTVLELGDADGLILLFR